MISRRTLRSIPKIVAASVKFALLSESALPITSRSTISHFIASYACFFGFTTHSGAEGVGKNTKATVVAGMTSILIGGFVLSKLLLL